LAALIARAENVDNPPYRTSEQETAEYFLGPTSSGVAGRGTDGVMRALHARGLIEEAGAETSGAILYRTTGDFLEYLGIDSLDELPPLAPYLPRVEALGEIVEQADEMAGRRTP